MNLKNKILLALALYIPGHLPAQYVKSSSAQEFVNSIGVTTHWGYNDTPYGFSFDTVFARLKESGIKHVRDGARMAELTAAGITNTLYADVPDNSNGDDKTIATLVSSMKAKMQAGYKFEVVEGPNEPDLFWVGYKRSYKGFGYLPNQTEVDRLASIGKGVIMFMQDFYKAIKADPVTAKLKVIGPSLGVTYDPGGGRPNPFPIGSLTDFVDYGNVHPYPGGNPFSLPDPYAGLDKYFWSGTQPSGNIDEWPYAFNTYWPPFKPKTMAATETGYSTIIGGIPESVHAKYIPRLFFEYFRAGFVITYLYEFLDEFAKPEDRESNFGLIRYNLTRKPAFNALKSVIQLLQDSDQSINPDSLKLKFTVTLPQGYDRIQYVRKLLFKKSDGSYYLVLYHEIAGSDGSKNPQTELEHPVIPITIDLDDKITSVNQYSYNDTYNFVKNQLSINENGSIKLEVSDKVTILQLGSNPLGLKNMNVLHNQILLTPNPSTDRVEIFSAQPGIISITDLTGHQVIQQYTSGLIDIDVSHLNKGLYIVIIKSEYVSTASKLKVE